MLELSLYSRRVETVFDLLGSKEDDMTYAVGWGLAQSERFARDILAEVYEDRDCGALSGIRLQDTKVGTGRTDIEVETERQHLIIEAKRGWVLPSHDQLQQYADRLNATDARDGRIAVVTECAADYPPVLALPTAIDGVPVEHIPWSRVAELVAHAAAASRGHAEKRLLRELHRYLRGLMTTQNTASNLVYVVALNSDPLDWCSLTFKDIVCQKDRYFHPVGGGKGGWPRTPPNYIGYRFDGRLQRIHHVEDYTVVTRPHEHLAEVAEWVDWTEQPHFLYTLGPNIVPTREVRTGKLYRGQRVWCALDLLHSAETVAQARDLTRERHEAAGIPYP